MMEAEAGRFMQYRLFFSKQHRNYITKSHSKFLLIFARVLVGTALEQTSGIPFSPMVPVHNYALFSCCVLKKNKFMPFYGEEMYIFVHKVLNIETCQNAMKIHFQPDLSWT